MLSQGLSVSNEMLNELMHVLADSAADDEQREKAALALPVAASATITLANDNDDETSRTSNIFVNIFAFI